MHEPNMNKAHVDRLNVINKSGLREILMHLMRLALKPDTFDKVVSRKSNFNFGSLNEYEANTVYAGES